MFDFSSKKSKKRNALKKARSEKAKLFALAGASLFFAISGQNVSAASTDTVIASEGSNVASTAPHFLFLADSFSVAKAEI